MSHSFMLCYFPLGEWGGVKFNVFTDDWSRAPSTQDYLRVACPSVRERRGLFLLKILITKNTPSLLEPNAHKVMKDAYC
jgi:hypothetical protein